MATLGSESSSPSDQLANARFYLEEAEPLINTTDSRVKGRVQNALDIAKSILEKISDDKKVFEQIATKPLEEQFRLLNGLYNNLAQRVRRASIKAMEPLMESTPSKGASLAESVAVSRGREDAPAIASPASAHLQQSQASSSQSSAALPESEQNEETDDPLAGWYRPGEFGAEPAPPPGVAEAPPADAVAAGQATIPPQKAVPQPDKVTAQAPAEAEVSPEVNARKEIDAAIVSARGHLDRAKRLGKYPLKQKDAYTKAGDVLEAIIPRFADHKELQVELEQAKKAPNDKKFARLNGLCTRLDKAELIPPATMNIINHLKKEEYRDHFVDNNAEELDKKLEALQPPGMIFYTVVEKGEVILKAAIKTIAGVEHVPIKIGEDGKMEITKGGSAISGKNLDDFMVNVADYIE